MRSTLARMMWLLAAVIAPAASAHAEQFVHPRHNYAISIPAGARIASPADADEIVIHSWAGFIVSLRTTAGATGQTIDELVARVENRYLGKGKSWTRKLTGGPAQLAELPAYAAEYEGHTGRVRILVARGRRQTFEIMFFAQPEDYAALVGVFDNLLASFRPATDSAGARQKTRTVRPAPAVEARPPDGQSESGETRISALRFQEPGFGFAIGYPSRWKREIPSPNAIIFQAGDGDATVSVQNVGAAPQEDGSGPAMAVAERLKKRLGAEATDVSYMGDGPVTYRRDGLDLDGHQFLAQYKYEDRRYKQLTVILVRPEGDVAHVWSYRAPVVRFDAYRPIATEMLKSWSITSPEPSGGMR